MPKLTIYVPGSLGDELREADLNVSAVCQKALEEEVRTMRARAETDAGILAVAARLRATAGEEERRLYADGFDLGQAWARETAPLFELRDVAEMRSEIWSELHPAKGTTLRDVFVEKFGAKQLRALQRGPFVEGFVQGAGEVYDAALPHVIDGQSDA